MDCTIRWKILKCVKPLRFCTFILLLMSSWQRSWISKPMSVSATRRNMCRLSTTRVSGIFVNSITLEMYFCFERDPARAIFYEPHGLDQALTTAVWSYDDQGRDIWTKYRQCRRNTVNACCYCQELPITSQVVHNFKCDTIDHESWQGIYLTDDILEAVLQWLVGLRLLEDDQTVVACWTISFITLI